MTQTAATQLRVAWLAIVLVAVVGFATIVLPAQRRIASTESRAADLADLAARNEALLARLDSIEQTRSSVRSDLDRLAGSVGPGRTTVAVLHVLEDEGKRNHVTISSIAPASDETSGVPQAKEELAVSLRGRYRDVMAAIADVPRHDALVEIESVGVARANTRALFPSVDATVRVALYRDVKDLAKENANARTTAH
jgi:Tfp pilus assembly protein PilO